MWEFLLIDFQFLQSCPQGFERSRNGVVLRFKSFKSFINLIKMSKNIFKPLVVFL